MKITADPKTKAYYSALGKKVKIQFDLASKARALGKDVTLEVESPPTLDLADRTENIIGPPGVAKRYRELYIEFKRNRTKAIFQLFKEIIEGDLGDIPDPEKRLEQAVKTGLVLVTEGVVVAPLDGVPKIQISKNPDGSKYVNIYFAGPIRAAGGTATVFPLILGDYARQLMKLDVYKPTQDEIERYVEEINIYDEIVTRQYKLKDDDVRKIIRDCPVCINGEPTEEREVTTHADLERIPTNRIRGGMCLVISEGVGLKAMKIMSLAKMLGLNWDWLENVIKMGKGTGKDKEIKPNFNYLSRLAAGRPIFAYPSTPGGFRLRYGRARNTSVMAKGVNPATMFILDDFMAVGTQTKIERPGKSAEMFPVDTIDGPIVKLMNDEVIKVNSAEEAKKINSSVKEIIFLGDILITLGDFRKTAHPLIPAGYCEEWWKLEFEKLSKEEKIQNFDVKSMLENPYLIEQDTAIELSMQLGLPLHPKYLHYYSLLSIEETIKLIGQVRKAEKEFSGNELKKLLLEKTDETKEYLEKIGLPHKIQEDKLIIEKEFAYSFFKTFGGTSNDEPNKELKPCEMLSELSGLTIKDKAGSFIGLRMGRPEAAKPRKMVGDPMVLFPIGDYGGNTRSITKAMGSNKQLDANIAYFLNSETNEIEETQFSHDSNKRNTRVRKCLKCGAYSQKETCEHCFSETEAFSKRKIDLIKTVEQATKNLKIAMPPLVKGVKGLINADKIPEPLEKGILRARHDLHIFRDATIRYELLNAPLTHFKPKEIGLSVEKAIELGYTEDFEGRKLVSEEQLCEIFPQDMIVHEGAGDFYVRVTRFIDEELERFYGIEKFFNINSPKELIGELFLALAPHTSAAVACRIIGYTKAKLNFAHPYFHLAKRRNCDGDQDSIMLLMDALINFSKKYLPSSRGGRMDAPLVFTTVIKPSEIDDEVYEVETCKEYPLELYEKSLIFADPELDSIPIIKNKIGKDTQYNGFGFTHSTEIFDLGPKASSYVTLQSMEDKMKAQAKLQNKIRAVDKKDALERVLMSHFLPDIIGNARAFSRQTIRCSKCNTKYRRPPLGGKCTSCGGDHLLLTIAQGSVKKYLNIAKKLISKYELSPYLSQRIGLIEKEIDSVFKNDKVQQKSLFEYM